MPHSPRLNPLVSSALAAALLSASAGAALAERTPAPQDPPRARSLAGNYLAGHFAGSSNDMNAAVGYYREALARDPRNPHLLERTFLLAIASGALDEGLTLAQTLAAQESTHRLARLALGIRHLKQGRYPEAKTNLVQASKGPLADLTGTLLNGWAQQGQKETDAALTAIDALASSPDWYNTFKSFHSGLIAEAAGRHEEAARRLGDAYRADGGALRIVEAHARAQARLGRFGEAQGALDRFEQTNPNHPLLGDARAAVAAKRVPEPAVKTVAQGGAEVLYGLGAALGREGGQEIAAVYLQLALYLEPTHPLAHFALADLYEAMDQRERAVQLFDRIGPASPLRRHAQVQSAINLNELGRTDEALQRLEVLLEADSSNLEAIETLGNVLRARERYAEAEAAYSRGLKALSEPNRRHWRLYYFRGIANERLKKWETAEADLLKALELSPEQPLVLNYLGYSWIDKGQNLEKGLDMIRKAVQLKPDDGYIVDSLGWAYYRLNRFEEGVTELERAVELRPQDPVINDHLGDAYWMAGRELEGRFQWNRALGLNPEPEERIKIEQKVKDGLRGATSAENKP